jgi:hypothetical protein
MSAVTFDTDLFPVQAMQEAPAAVMAATATDAAASPGLFSRMLEAFGRAYTYETPDGDVLYVYPF